MLCSVFASRLFLLSLSGFSGGGPGGGGVAGFTHFTSSSRVPLSWGLVLLKGERPGGGVAFFTKGVVSADIPTEDALGASTPPCPLPTGLALSEALPPAQGGRLSPLNSNNDSKIACCFDTSFCQSSPSENKSLGMSSWVLPVEPAGFQDPCEVLLLALPGSCCAMFKTCGPSFPDLIAVTNSLGSHLASNIAATSNLAAQAPAAVMPVVSPKDNDAGRSSGRDLVSNPGGPRLSLR